MALSTITRHSFSFNEIKPRKISRGGTRKDVYVGELSVLKGMALSLLEILPQGVREPHWHPNAHELGYCLEGQGMMTIFSPGSEHDTFTIEAGSITFVPRGSMHHIENTGKNPLKMVLCFSNENPEDLDFAPGISSMPNHILAETCRVPESFFEKLNNRAEGFVTTRTNIAKPLESFMTNRFKMDLERKNPQIDVKGGTVKMSNNFLMPTLEELSVYSVLLRKKGGREPHWHPNADELNFLSKGRARITLYSPSGESDTFDMKAGDLSFMPRGYLHYIENIGDDDAQFVIFFNHTAPSDIGFSGCFGAYSNDVLSSMFGLPASYFDQLPKQQQDVFVISGGG